LNLLGFCKSLSDGVRGVKAALPGGSKELIGGKLPGDKFLEDADGKEDIEGGKGDNDLD
jgi:hypothetical protein